MSHRSVPGDTSNSPGQGSAQDCFKCVAKQFAECDLIQLPGLSVQCSLTIWRARSLQTHCQAIVGKLPPDESLATSHEIQTICQTRSIVT